MHYDDEDNGVFKCTRVVEEVYDGETFIVVYRQRLGKNGVFGKELSRSVHVRDVEKYHTNTENINILNQKLSKFHTAVE